MRFRSCRLCVKWRSHVGGLCAVDIASDARQELVQPRFLLLLSRPAPRKKFV